MDHYSYQKQLKEIWQSAVAKYESGNREPDTYFDEATLAELASVGLNTMDVYDYAEDWVTRGEPDFETFLMVCEARRDYFFKVMGSQPSAKRLDPDSSRENRRNRWHRMAAANHVEGDCQAAWRNAFRHHVWLWRRPQFLQRKQDTQTSSFARLGPMKIIPRNSWNGWQQDELRVDKIEH